DHGLTKSPVASDSRPMRRPLNIVQCRAARSWQATTCADRSRWPGSLGQPAAGCTGRTCSAPLPQPEPAGEGLCVFSDADVAGQALEELRVAAADDHAVRFERRAQDADDFEDVLVPVLLAQTAQALRSGVVLVAPALLVGEVAQLHRLEIAVDDHRRAH